ncbi:glycosyltransferase family 2 protein [Micromonospora chokoriensis]|uniref:Glycosyltransferase, GT2 family n=1 Tax=Micromonospora chokoriensis TaxID=356851 RepID=A0A1C4XSZ8_9ACTN|nr:glycosyltransferase family 2 protein [Micromonospora chokoriensis]SCF11629.1 Glycosyltransferase, GT2 family [Micromonospora chokoriensis]
MGTPQLSVLLVSWNTREQTRQCLESLAATADPDLDYEVVAVDNGSTDGSADLLADQARVRLIRNSHNTGFAAAVNQAYRRSTGQLVLLLNSDVRFHPGALSRMIGYLRERPDVAGVSPLYLNPDGTFQQHYVQQPSFAATIALVTALRRLPGFRQALHRFQMRGEDFSRPRQLASGSCMLLRRAVLGQQTIFDEAFPVYWNDAVLARQLAQAGHELWMIPDAVVTHTRGASCRLLGPAIRFRHLLGSMVEYLRLTQPRHRMVAFRAALLADHLVKRLLGRPVQLDLADLLAALRGDVGPLPDGDTRDWVVLFSRTRWSVPQHQTVLEQLESGQRLLFVDPPGRRPRWRSEMTPIGSTAWRAVAPTALPLGDWLPPVNWINRRVAAGVLRAWLDRQAGARLLRLDDERARPVLGRLGEDEVLPAGAPRPLERSGRG